MNHESQDTEFLAWFAGFTAGEGCFFLQTGRRNNWWYGGFSIALRDDDLPLLLELQERLQMGTISSKRVVWPDRPQAVWRVARIADCVRLVDIFTAHPLRGKKEADFEIWKQAVKMIREGGSRKGGPSPTYDCAKLQYLNDRLRFVKTYRSSECSLQEEDNSEEDGTLQLAIWENEEELTK